jgi:hypothetical protein
MNEKIMRKKKSSYPKDNSKYLKHFLIFESYIKSVPKQWIEGKLI